MNFLVAELPDSPPVPFPLGDNKWALLYGGAVIMGDEPSYPLVAYFPGPGGMAMALRVNDALKAEQTPGVGIWRPTDGFNTAAATPPSA